ncbi:DUF4258 domain-containing protein [Flavihumibacter petaseus]|uniref:DUF4258 domain-containing protein n=1 Tax=Flavihumibacter petaseus NBRC 106054 TaxID=1220578 RepID=A0A0E9N1L0_9BACT|nr:DUF4258 domain-containing protein [Flavihumibacter petaseus]GAO43739.1 hypothetical protein FPE01S_02_08450 [Flavihumibacter petaseus NBRC 106054]
MRFKRSYGWVLIVVLAIVLIIRLLQGNKAGNATLEDRNPAHLSFTRHARCRMECREISEADVRYILQHGTINNRKSDPDDRPCPSVAVEGYSPEDKHHLRIVVGTCDKETRVITCIDLDQDFTCNCP